MINKVSKEVRPRVKDFLNVASNSFKFLEEYGYMLKEERIATEYVVNDVIEVIYQNEKLDKLIIIHYEPIDIEQKDIDYLTVMIYKGEKSYKNKLELDIFIEKYHSDFDTNVLSDVNKNNKKSFKENMEASMLGYAYFLKDIGIKLISGNEWESGLIYDLSSAEEIIYKQQKKGLGNG